jgi:hypothetical protein
MQALLIFLIVLTFSSYASAGGMTVPGATQEAILHDCRVTAELSVELLKMRVKKTEPAKMEESSKKLLTSKGYKESFGEIGFIAGFYTGMALQQGEELERMMAGLSEEDFALMVEDHEILCIKSAFAGEGGSSKRDEGAGHGNLGGQGGIPPKE